MINFIRQKPFSTSKEIVKLSEMLVINNEKYILEANGKKFLFRSGLQEINKSMEVLKGTYPLKPLVFNQDLLIDIPEKEEERLDSGIISRLINLKVCELRERISQNYLLLNIDLTPFDPKIASILQIIDDSSFKGQRRSNLLNPILRQIAVSVKKDKKSRFYIYIALA